MADPKPPDPFPGAPLGGRRLRITGGDGDWDTAATWRNEDTGVILVAPDKPTALDQCRCGDTLGTISITTSTATCYQMIWQSDRGTGQPQRSFLFDGGTLTLAGGQSIIGFNVDFDVTASGGALAVNGGRMDFVGGSLGTAGNTLTVLLYNSAFFALNRANMPMASVTWKVGFNKTLDDSPATLQVVNPRQAIVGTTSTIDVNTSGIFDLAGNMNGTPLTSIGVVRLGVGTDFLSTITTAGGNLIFAFGGSGLARVSGDVSCTDTVVLLGTARGSTSAIGSCSGNLTLHRCVLGFNLAGANSDCSRLIVLGSLGIASCDLATFTLAPLVAGFREYPVLIAGAVPDMAFGPLTEYQTTNPNLIPAPGNWARSDVVNGTPVPARRLTLYGTR